MARAEQGGDSSAQLQRLIAMDKNQDGKVSKEEFTGPPEMFVRLDTNKDGFITPPEARASSAAGGGPGQLTTPPKASTGLVPLNELGTGTYEGKPGGLYPCGRNDGPSAHEEAGLRLARLVRPLDKKGQAADDGKIALLSIGMSNTTQEFSTFKTLADADPTKNPKLVLVDGAQGGMTASVIINLESPRGQQYWQTVDERLSQAGVSCCTGSGRLGQGGRCRALSQIPRVRTSLSTELERDRPASSREVPESQAGLSVQSHLRRLGNHRAQPGAVRLRVGLRREVAGREANRGRPRAQSRRGPWPREVALARLGPVSYGPTAPRLAAMVLRMFNPTWVLTALTRALRDAKRWPDCYSTSSRATAPRSPGS